MMFGRLIVTEIQKLRRYPVLLIGAAGMLFNVLYTAYICVVDVTSDYDFSHFTSSVIWGNFDVFFPAIITLTAGYMISREITDDTLKNILTVPISFKKLLAGKIAAVVIVAAGLGVLLWIMTLVTGGIIFGTEGLVMSRLFWMLIQMCLENILITVACLPIILATCKQPGYFPMGVGFAFFYGFCGSIVAGHGLGNWYPPSAVLTLIGYDNANGGMLHYTPSFLISGMVMALVLLVSLIMMIKMKEPGDIRRTEKKKQKRR